MANGISGLSDDRDIRIPMPVYIDWQIGFLDYQMIDRDQRIPMPVYIDCKIGFLDYQFINTGGPRIS